MKKFLEFADKLDFYTKLTVRCGMTASIVFSLIGTIIYRFGENFNININKFALSEQFISSAAAFLICTLIVAALCEYCMRKVHNEVK